jgi:hypothetical protein
MTAADSESAEEKVSRSSLGDLLGDVTRDISSLMRQEVELARAELTQSAKRAGAGAGMFGGAGVAGHMALLFLSIAAWWALGDAIGRGWSGLIVAVVYAIVALILFLIGKKRFASIKGMPQTADSVKKIPEALKPEKIR